MGLRETGDRIAKLPHVYSFYQEWNDDIYSLARKFAYCKEKLLFVGHSFGAATLIDVATQLDPYPIEHLILLDPVLKRHWYSPIYPPNLAISDNVKQATCFKREPHIPPWPSFIHECRAPHQNILKKGFNHNQFCSDPEIAEFIYGSVLAAIK